MAIAQRLEDQATTRISCDRARHLLGKDFEHLSDVQVEELVHSLYGLSQAIVTEYMAQSPLYSASKLEQNSASQWSEDDLAAIEERAAIMEFDGKLHPRAAHRLAGRSKQRH